MTPAARIQATLEILQEIEIAPRPADAVTGAYFRARRFIGSKDRGAIAERLYAVLRHRARLDWWVGKSGMLPLEGGEGESGLPRLRLLVWLALGEKTTAAIIDELFSGGKYAPGKLSDAEQNLLKKIEGGTVEHPDMPEQVIGECPPHLADILKQKFGRDFMREMRAMQEPATLDLRVNSLKATREEILAALREMGLKADICPLSPWGVRVFARVSLNELPMLRNGLVEIQDEGSQLVALAVGAKPGERVMDFCAGAGGKTLAIAAMMQNKGRITACDIMEHRLKNSADRLRRAGVHNVQSRVLTGARDAWIKKHKGAFDRVLCDAPCGGTGTWRRNPDARWHEFGPALDVLVQTQAEILDSAARLVRPGGTLIYATCSLLRDENENQVEKFLATHADFALTPCGLQGEDYLSLSPAQHGTDGFFAATMQRAKKVEPIAPSPATKP